MNNLSQCIKKFDNGDTSINERVCLIIDDCIFLTEHADTFNFAGGHVPHKYITENRKLGITSLKELKEELGIVIKKGKRVFNLISFQYDEKIPVCPKILVLLNVKKEWIKFKKATHVWATAKFTLLPLDTNISDNIIDNLGTYLEQNIQAANLPCSTHIKIDASGNIIPISGDEVKSDKDVTKQHVTDNDEYIVRLTKNPKLDSQQIQYLDFINSRTNRFRGNKYVFENDNICNFKYVSAIDPDNKLRFTISQKFLTHLNLYTLDLGYLDLLKYFLRHDTRLYNSTASDNIIISKIKKLITELKS